MRQVRIYLLGLLVGVQTAAAQNVGIGTSSPLNRLHVDGAPATDATATGGAQLRISESTNNYFMLLGRTTGTTGYGFIQTHNSQPLALNPEGNNVGIGTTLPQGRLGIRAGSENWIALQDGISNNIYVFHNPASGDRLEIGLYHAAASTWRWGRMVFRQEGNIGINTTTPNSRAILDISSTSQGLLIPRLTTAQRDAIPDPIPQGLIIYNTTTNCIEFFDTSDDPPGGPTGGFWNSVCLYCDYNVTINSNATGFNLRDHIIAQGIPLGAYTYCVYVLSGVTLQAAGNGGGAGADGNPGFNASTMPNGAKVILYNYGTLLAGGGNGGRGGRESDSACEGDQDGQAGGRGGDAILTNSSAPIFVYNYGTLRAGGGGGGGGRGGCCSAGGGGGGGAGTPPGAGGPGGSYRCVGGTLCPCSGRTGTANSGSAGTATSGGAGGGGICSGGSSCPGTSSGCGSPGGAGGTNGAAGAPGSTVNGCCAGGCNPGPGGGAGYAINGNGSGSRLIANTGTVVGAVIP